MSGAFAPGRKAWGICGRSGARALLKDLVFDGRFPNLRVLPDWFESRHPQETQKDIRDSIALYRPAPESLPPPAAPVLEGEQEDNEVVLSWTESTSVISLVVAYLLYRAAGAAEFELVYTLQVERDDYGAPITDLEFVDEGLTDGETYRYYVVARAIKGGDSAPSNIVEIEFEEEEF